MSLLNSAGMLFARKWIAGSSIGDAIAEARRMNAMDERVIMNYLGEDLRSRRHVENDVTQILLLLKEMHSGRIKGSIAVKPTQLGIVISTKYFLENYRLVIKEASKCRITVWFDMEQYKYVDATINAYLQNCKKHKNTGICIQAKLKRSLKDVKKITVKQGKIRLVKGAYKYPAAIAFQSPEEVEENYLDCMDYLFKNAKEFMIATHDENIINIAMNGEKKYKKRIMFGMLKGIRPKLAAKLANSGENINIYTPYGEQWLKYAARRMTEWEHAKIILRSIIQG